MSRNISPTLNAPDPTVEIDFIQKSIFKHSYYRNNRAYGQKNLRCFPNCFEAHFDRHFCGRPLLIAVTMVSHSSSVTVKDVVLIGTFNLLPLQPEDESSEFLEDYLDHKDNSSGSTGKSEGRLPLYFPGRIVKTGVQTIIGDTVVSTCLAEFNGDCRGWHYGWNGSRFRTDMSHVFTVSAYAPSKSREIFLSHTQRYVRLCSANSPQFIIVSLRRRGSKLLVKSFQKVESNQDLVKRFLSTNVCLGTFEEFMQLTKSHGSDVLIDGDGDGDGDGEDDSEPEFAMSTKDVECTLKRKASSELCTDISELSSKEETTSSLSSLQTLTPLVHAPDLAPAVGEVVVVRGRSEKAVVIAYAHPLDLVVEYVDSRISDTVKLCDIETEHFLGESAASLDYL